MKRFVGLLLAVLIATAVYTPATVLAAGTGMLKITASPEGADVYIDGIFQNTVTPCEIQVTQGTHKVDLKIPGYEAYTRQVISITAGKNTVLQAALLPYLPKVDANHTVTVTTLEDKARWKSVAEMNALTVAELKADKATAISLREAIAAVKNEPDGGGQYRIEFATALSGGVIHLFGSNDFPVPDGMLQNLYVEKRGNLTINGDINRDGIPDITLDASQNGVPNSPKGTILNVYTSNVTIAGLRFMGSAESYPDEYYDGVLSTLILRVPDKHSEKYDIRNISVLGCSFTNSGAVGTATCGVPGGAATAYGGAKSVNYTNLIFAGNTFNDSALFTFAGAGDEDYNVIDGYTAAANKFTGKGIGLLAADAHTWYVLGSGSGPIEYCNHNQFKNITISGNDITVTEKNTNAALISIQTANLGNSDNLIENVTIRNNKARAALSSPDPESPKRASYASVSIITADAGADARFTAYTSPSCRHNTADNTMRNVTVTNNEFTMGNGRCFSVGNVYLGYTEKSGMDATGNRLENIVVKGNSIISSCGARIFGIAGDGAYDMNDVSGNTTRNVRFEANTLTRADNGLYEHRGLTVAGFMDQRNTFLSSYHDNTMGGITINGNKISNFRTGVIVTGSAGNGANAHGVSDVTVNGNTVTCSKEGDFGMIAAGAAISGYGGDAFNGSADCYAKDVRITGNTVTAPGGLLLAGTYIDSPVKNSIERNSLSGVTVSGNRLNSAAGVPEHMHLPGITVADIAARWSNSIQPGTATTGNTVGTPAIGANVCTGFHWSAIDLAKYPGDVVTGCPKTSDRILGGLTQYTDAAAGSHLYDWDWDGPTFSAANPAEFTAKGVNKTGDGIEMICRSVHTVTADISSPTLSVNALSYASVRLSWSGRTGASGYEVYRAVSASGPWVKLKTVTDTGYTDAALTSGKPYYYKTRACFEAKEVFFGEYSTIKSSTPVPAAPAGIKAIRVSSSGIKISWNPVDGRTMYEIYRSTSANGPYKLLTSTQAMSYTDNGLKAGKEWYYKVRAYRLVNNKKVYGGFSASVHAMP